MSNQAPAQDAREQDGFSLVDMLAHMDLIELLDAWFGHWWNRPFWKAEKPLVAFLENLTWQGHKRFAIPRAGDVSGYEAEVFLRNHGVYVWGRGFDSANVYFNVKKEQASWAEYLLAREGIATVNAPVDPRNRAWAERHDGAPPGWGSNKKTVGDFIIGVFASGPKAAMRRQSRGREWPAASAKRPRKTARKSSRRGRKRKKQQTTMQRLAIQAGQRMNRRRPRRPARPGQPRQK